MEKLIPTVLNTLPLAEKKVGDIRLVSISDTHGQIDKVTIPKGDILIHCGDISTKGSKHHFIRSISTLISLPHTYKVIIGGNHDYYLDLDRRSQL